MSRSVSAPSSVTNTSPCWNGDIVPGSTFKYGSNFNMVTRSPRSTSKRPSEAAAIPFPREETTPPVTKMNRVGSVVGSVAMLSPPSMQGENPFRFLEVVLGVDPAGRGDLRHHSDAYRLARG